MLIIFRKSKAHPPLGLCERAICFLWPLNAVLSSGLCGKEGGPTSCDKLNRSDKISAARLPIGYALTICPPIGQAVSYSR